MYLVVQINVVKSSASVVLAQETVDDVYLNSSVKHEASLMLKLSSVRSENDESTTALADNLGDLNAISAD